MIHCSLVQETKLLVSVWLALLNGCGFENGKQIVRQIPVKDMEDNKCHNGDHELCNSAWHCTPRGC